MAAMPRPLPTSEQDCASTSPRSTTRSSPSRSDLTDEQARSTPTVSALSIGALIKHVTGVQRGWMQRVAAALR